jgi:precorrin-2 dehydrogenase/sirohydrochlorin ferrochelatase
MVQKNAVRTYPICLVGLESRRAVVIGGGRVAARKAQALLEAGASILCISPEFCDEFRALEENPRLEMIARPYRSGDLAEAFIVIAATDDPQVNQAVWGEALRWGCLVNVVDDPQHSNFILPAVVQRGELKIAVTTGGASPALARRLRERLESLFGPEYGELAQLMAELRPELQARFTPGELRLRAALSLVDSDLLEIIRRDGMEAARRWALDFLTVRQEKNA